MASYSKTEAGTWRVQVARQGVRRSETFETKAQARAWAEALEAEIVAGKRGQFPRKTVKDAFDRYAAEVSIHKRTAGKEELRLQAFSREPWAQKWLVDLTAEDLGKWRDQRLLAVQGESIRRDLTVMSAVFTHCIKEWKWMGANPARDVKWPAKGKPRTRTPGWREIKRVCRSCGYVTGQPPGTKTAQIAYALLISLRTAMRKGEILGLTSKTVDLKARVAVLEETKNGDRREVPLSRKAVRLLRPMLPDLFTIQPESLDAIWRKVCRRVGVDGLHFHDARAAALSSMAKRVPLVTLARISGHRNLNQLSVYYRDSSRKIADML